MPKLNICAVKASKGVSLTQALTCAEINFCRWGVARLNPAKSRANFMCESEFILTAKRTDWRQDKS